MTTKSKDISMPKRNMDFQYGTIGQPFFFKDNALLSTFFASMSVIFPPGEKEFVKSVALFRNKIENPVLRTQVRDFTAQEAQHRRQHQLANEQLDALGYNATEHENHFEAEVQSEVKKFSAKQRLAGTVCAEHITAILGHALLSNPDLVAEMEEPVRELLYWHAVEELEHKGVAFDVFIEAVGDRKFLRGALLVQTYMFSKAVLRYQFRMLRALKYRPNQSDVAETWAFFLGKNGIFPKLRKPYLEFFRKDFHPWDIDDSDLIESWKSKNAANAA